MADRLYFPGENVQHSGIYVVSHYHDHAPPHEVLMQADDLFLPCRTCGVAVRYQLKQPVAHLREHPCFRQRLGATDRPDRTPAARHRSQGRVIN